MWIALAIMAFLVIAAPFLVRYLNVSETNSHEGRLLPHGFLSIIAWCGFVLLGFMATAVTTLALVDICRLFFALVHFVLNGTNIDAQAFSPERRKFIFTYLPWGAFGAAALFTAKGFQTAMKGPIVKRVSIPKIKIHPSLEGLKIVQISDLHIGNLIRRPFVEKVVKTTLALEPDIIMLTGDMVDGSPAGLADDIEPLKELKAKYGIYFITGNHEYYSGAKTWSDYFRSQGIEVLSNSHKVLEIKKADVKESARLVIAGVPDFTAERFGFEGPDAVKAMKGSPKSDYTIMLAHQPNSYRETEKIECDLQLSGHTHSGQFYPVRFFIGLFQKYYQGLYRHQDKFWIYVNQGTGFWGPPNRLGLPSEITLLTLRSPE
ncbi:MAG: metallophosphoesterase [Bacteriovoracaceae bacterium]|nr:metallophosphoesterase [Bacteriovoracaceae bacterium]